MLTSLYKLITQAETEWLGPTISKRRKYFVRQLSRYYKGSNRAKAKQMFTHLARYQMARWEYDKNKPIVPDKYRNKQSEWYFRLLKENSGTYLKEETIRKILNEVGGFGEANAPTDRVQMNMKKSFDPGSCIGVAGNG